MRRKKERKKANGIALLSSLYVYLEFFFVSNASTEIPIQATYKEKFTIIIIMKHALAWATANCNFCVTIYYYYFIIAHSSLNVFCAMVDVFVAFVLL